jgi:hypothetical protein
MSPIILAMMEMGRFYIFITAMAESGKMEAKFQVSCGVSFCTSGVKVLK